MILYNMLDTERVV